MPVDDAMIIDARIGPVDIDIVHAGLTAQVQLPALSSRLLPRLTGTVRTR